MKKYVFLATCLFLLTNYANSIELDDVKMPLPIEYRLGTSDEVEQKYEVVNPDITSGEAILQKEKEAVKKVTYADLSLKKISKELTSDLKNDEKDILEDLKTLWVGAASKSESVRFAIYKLSNPDEDKPSNTAVKKIIKPLASMTALAGMGLAADPYIGTAAMMGSTLLNGLGVTDKDLNYKYSKVTDADMVVLVRKIDELQKNLTYNYYEYMAARAYLNQMNAIVTKRAKLIDKNENASKVIIQVLDTYYKEAADDLDQARTDFLYVRSTLEQLVGADCLAQFEKAYADRIKDK